MTRTDFVDDAQTVGLIAKIVGVSAAAAAATSPAAAQDALAPFEGYALTIGSSISTTSYAGIADASAYDGKSSNVAATSFNSFGDLGGATAFGLGYDMAIGNNRLLGIRAVVRLGTAGRFDGTHSDVSGGKATGGDLSFFGEIEESFELSARLGMLAAENTLIYAMAGGAIAQYSIGGTYDTDATSPFSWDDQGTVLGGVIGFGVEYMLPTGIAVGAELAHTQFENVNVEYSSGLDSAFLDYDASSTRLTVFFAHRF